MQKLVADRLPKINPQVSKFLNGSLDFLGINHYTSLYARNDRTRIRKFLLRDATTDSAVITSCKTQDFQIFFQFLLNSCQNFGLMTFAFDLLAHRHGKAIGERVCPAALP